MVCIYGWLTPGNPLADKVDDYLAATAALYVTDPGHKRAGSDTIEARPLEQSRYR